MWGFFKSNPDALSGSVKPYDPNHPGIGPPTPQAPQVPTTPYRINPSTKAPEKLVNGKYVPMWRFKHGPGHTFQRQDSRHPGRSERQRRCEYDLRA